MDCINQCTKTISVLNIVGPVAKHITELKAKKDVECDAVTILKLLMNCEDIQSACDSLLKHLNCFAKSIADLSSLNEMQTISSMLNNAIKGLYDSTKELHRGDVTIKENEELWCHLLNYLEELFGGLLQALLTWDRSNLKNIYSSIDDFLYALNCVKEQPKEHYQEQFQNITGKIKEVFSLIYERCRDITGKQQKQMLSILCFQIHSFLSILTSVLANCAIYPKNKQFKATRNFVLTKIHQISADLKTESGLGSQLYELESPAIFINTVDDLFDIIKPQHTDVSVVSKHACVKVLKEPLELVLKYAVGLAYCCCRQDNNSIMAACESVLHQMKVLADIERSPDVSSVDTEVTLEVLSDVLDLLELKVNMSVIRLIVQVFSDPFVSLGKLLEMLKQKMEVKDASIPIQKNGTGTDVEGTSAVEPLIKAFEGELDTICQIGYFTIACTMDENRSQRIESSLAVLEWLESILVPCITNCFESPLLQPYENASLLAKLWVMEVVKFRNIIYLSMDQPAFCLVAKQEVHEIWAQLQESIDYSDQDYISKLIHRVICITSSILTLDRASLFLYDYNRNEIKTALKEVKKYKNLMQEMTLNADHKKNLLRRVQLVLTILSRLATDLNQEFLLKTECEEIIYGSDLRDKIPQLSDTEKKILVSSKIEDVPFDVDTPASKLQCKQSEGDNNLLLAKSADPPLYTVHRSLHKTPKRTLKEKSLKLTRRSCSEEVLAKIANEGIKRQLFQTSRENEAIDSKLQNVFDPSIDITKFLLSRSTNLFRNSERGSKRNFSLKVKEMNMDIGDILNIKPVIEHQERSEATFSSSDDQEADSSPVSIDVSISQRLGDLQLAHTRIKALRTKL